MSDMEEDRAGLIRYSLIKTAMGHLGLVFTPQGIARLILPGLRLSGLRKSILTGYPGAREGLTEEYQDTVAKLKAYFSGQRVEFDCPLDLDRSTPFQRKVYGALLKIPYGEVRSYAWVAQSIGNPGAVRAVGQANSSNPIALIIPCHRVIRSDGSLGGFSAKGGLELKRKMLQLENALEPNK